MYASRDHGENEEVIDTGPDITVIRDMWYDKGIDILYVAGNGGVIRCQDPVNAIP